MAFGYDADRLLTQAGALTIAREATTGLVTGTTLGSTTETVAHSAFGELSRQTATVSGDEAFDVQYVRDALGRITHRMERVDGITRTFEYAYDQAGRLGAVRRNGTLVVLYTYDANGNRTVAEGEAGLVTATYDAQDRLLTYGATSYTYTANGELATKTTAGQTTGYLYDTLGNLLQVTKPNGQLITYTVDGRGRRVRKAIDGVAVKGWLYADQLRPVAELDGTGTVVSRFVYGTKSNVPEYVIKNGEVYRIVSDHVGTPRLVVHSTTGAIVQRLDVQAFGELIGDTAPGWQPFGFAGGLYDPDTGLVRFGARDYDAQAGRWTAKDPIGFAGGDTNLYGYVVFDPINLADPSGFDWVASVNVSLTAGANLGLGIPFFGGGLGFGFNFSTGQLLVQATANSTVGAGAFAGVGLGGSIGYTPCGLLRPGFSTETAGYAQANAGWGPAWGVSVAATRDGGSVGTSLRGATIGAGYGIAVGAGASTTTTFVPWGPLW